MFAAIGRFFLAAFKGVQGGIAYNFGSPERRKLSAQAIIFTIGFLAIERLTVGWYWLPVALLDTAFVLVINAIALWAEGGKPITITPGATVRQSGTFLSR